jgi:hypothetical protein
MFLAVPADDVLFPARPHRGIVAPQKDREGSEAPMVPNSVRAVSTASAWTSSVNWEMKILESRLILNVTVLASEPDDHLADGEPVKHRVVAPASLALLPGCAQVERFLGLGLSKDDFIGVPHGDERGGTSWTVSGIKPSLSASQTTTKLYDTNSSIALTRTVVKATR